MNDFSSIDNSAGLLKNDQKSDQESDVSRALRKRLDDMRVKVKLESEQGEKK